VYASRRSAIDRTEGDIDSLRSVIGSLGAAGLDEDDRVVRAASALLRARLHLLGLLDWPSGAP